MNIELDKIEFFYNTKSPILVLSDISCRIDQGELVGVIGKTGSGKTTLLQLFSGMLSPNSGKVRIDGIPIRNAKDWNTIRTKIGIMFQFPEKQLFEEKVISDVSFGISRKGRSRDEIIDRARKAMESTGLAPRQFENRSPHQLSNGERRKVAIAGVLAMDSDVIFFDEPTIGLDYNSAKEIEAIIESLHSQGKTVCVVSHNIDFVMRIVNRVIVVADGKIKYDGQKEKLFSDKNLLRTLSIDKPEIVILSEELQGKVEGLNSNVYDLNELIRIVKRDRCLKES
jgi:energy-coupling factor transport system ATP-binding protein